MAKKKSTTSTDGDTSEPAPGPRPYVVLARKYRPQSFDNLIGQDAMVTTLRNAFQSGRLAQGYMLTGVRGVGKTTTARILARALSYEADGVDQPTIDMPTLGIHCADIMEGRHPDVFEMDAASNTGIDNIREIIERAQYTPIVARTKVFIIDEVHMLSKGAFNALLKTLEEPPAHVRFIFATTEIRKVPVTVLSRCQRFDLRRVEQSVLIEHFKKISHEEGADAEVDALALIARAAEGSVRDGLSILDQAIAMGEGRVSAEIVRDMLGLADRGRIFDLAELVFKGNAKGALDEFGSLYRDGAEALQIVTDLAEAVHIIARIKAVGEAPAGETLSVDEKRRGSDLASKLSMPYLSRAWQVLLKASEEVGRAPQPHTAAEMALIRLTYMADLPTPDELIRTLGGEAVSVRQTATSSSDSDGQRPLLNEAGSQPVAVEAEELDDDDSNIVEDGLGLADEEDIATGGLPADPRSFAEVVALAGAHRDAQLKFEDQVSLVKFDAQAGSIDIFLLPNAAPEIANELREKLNRWTGRRWVVVVSKSPGEPPIGEVRRKREADALAEVQEHPAIKSVMKVFPDARIDKVVDMDGRIESESDVGDSDESQAG